MAGRYLLNKDKILNIKKIGKRDCNICKIVIFRLLKKELTLS